mgnify:CR=1 FL=1
MRKLIYEKPESTVLVVAPCDYVLMQSKSNERYTVDGFDPAFS